MVVNPISDLEADISQETLLNALHCTDRQPPSGQRDSTETTWVLGMAFWGQGMPFKISSVRCSL